MTYSISKVWGIAIALIFTLSIVTCLFINITLIWGLTFTIAIALTILKFNGIDFKISGNWVLGAIISLKGLYIIIFMIGINVSMWIASGIVPTLIYYGFDIVEKVHFLLFAYVISGCLAFFLGTGLGTLSTIGIALYSLGISAGLPNAVLVGALLSGAYIADRLSPISALVSFTLESIQIPFRTYFKKTLVIMMPAMVITAIFFYLLSLKYSPTLSSEVIFIYKGSIEGNFVTSLAFLLVPIIVLWISFRGVGTSKVLLVGIVIGALITVFVQGETIVKVIQFMLFGFKSTGSDSFIKTLEIGGAVGMLEVVFIIMAGISMSTLYDKCGWIKPIIDFIARRSTTKRKTVLWTGLLSILLNALTCDQTVGIIIPGRHLKTVYEKNNLAPEVLGQVIANSGTSFAPLMPWNVNAIIILAITGVNAIQYAPYTILNWISFPLSILLTGLVFKRSSRRLLDNL